jgi:hypothetical protein
MASARDLLDRLETGLDDLLDSDHFRRWLTVQARFHHYSFGNILLIATQYPTATRVAGFHTWRKLGRSVKKGVQQNFTGFLGGCRTAREKLPGAYLRLPERLWEHERAAKGQESWSRRERPRNPENPWGFL